MLDDFFKKKEKIEKGKKLGKVGNWIGNIQNIIRIMQELKYKY